jgi:translation initiation factor 1
MDLKFDDNDLFSKNIVTISVQKRNGRQCITTISGMAEDLDLKKIISYFKRTYNCNGSIIKDEQFGEVITLTGDQKENIYNFLIGEEINKKDEIIVKGI